MDYSSKKLVNLKNSSKGWEKSGKVSAALLYVDSGFESRLEVGVCTLASAIWSVTSIHSLNRSDTVAVGVARVIDFFGNRIDIKFIVA